jgi:hypothetical protein
VKKNRIGAEIGTITGGTLLASEGDELVRGRWERCVYLGTDNFVYELETSKTAGEVKSRVAGKRKIGDYLRWVDGLFQRGELPAESNGIHYRAARLLRELI